MNNHRQPGRQILMAILAFTTATILLLWGWNNAIPDIFGLPPIQFKQAMGLMVFFGIISLILRPDRRHRKKHAHHSVMSVEDQS